jgi:hypothetical protein
MKKFIDEKIKSLLKKFIENKKFVEKEKTIFSDNFYIFSELCDTTFFFH